MISITRIGKKWYSGDVKLAGPVKYGNYSLQVKYINGIETEQAFTMLLRKNENLTSYSGFGMTLFRGEDDEDHNIIASVMKDSEESHRVIGLDSFNNMTISILWTKKRVSFYL
eukprot:TRINITY_DN5842_c0_g1_i4.p1 TRINITY_DN5842_c0_g1~~TRINITY_DN5842_c0_g1_i4.p1  ORF type:complete len:113 (-),score=12.77 TRINITY_DN5842_c0_g1_i4:91-429(-)